MSVAVLGEAIVDFIAGDDGAYRPHLGGSPYNVAIGLARQGISVSYLSPLADDTFGDQLTSLLRAEGVAVPFARRSQLPTSLSLVSLDEGGIPAYRLYRDGVADKDYSLDEVRRILPNDLDVFHTGSLAITPSQLPRIRALLDLMRNRGVIASLDINIRLAASKDPVAYLAGVRSLLPSADIVKASDEDLQPFGLAANSREAAELAYKEMGEGIFMLTRGARGALLFSACGTVEVPAYSVEQTVDTVGAGDTFHSAFLASLVRDGTLRGGHKATDRSAFQESLDFACAAAAINVTRAGCNPPTLGEVEAFMASEPS